MQSSNFLSLFKSSGATSPVRDWVLILLVAIFLLIGECSYAGYLYIQAVSGGAVLGTTNSSASAVHSITAEELQRVIDTFEARKLDFETRNFRLPADLFDPAK